MLNMDWLNKRKGRAKARQTGAKGDAYVCLHMHVGVVFISFLSKGCVLPHLQMPILCWQARRRGTHKNTCVCQRCHEGVHLHRIMLKGDNVVSWVQECVASGEHLCVGVLHVPAVSSGLQVSMHGTCMCTCVHPSAVLRGEQRVWVRICSSLKASVHL